jgi:hypothetical protein
VRFQSCTVAEFIKVIRMFVIYFRSHYIQELLLATTHEISQIVINEPPAANPITLVANVEPLNVDESVEQHGAEAVFVDELPVGAEAMKKSFIRKKEIPSTDDGKKQKSKVANARK